MLIFLHYGFRSKISSRSENCFKDKSTSQISQTDRGWHNDGLINDNGQILIDKKLGLVREERPFVMIRKIFIERPLGEAQARSGLLTAHML